MILTEANYHSPEASMAFMGASQYKHFQSCPAAALAACRGEYKRETTTALLVGSYVDAHFSGTLDTFRAQHPEIFKKDGGLKSEYIQAEEIIVRLERDPIMMLYLRGEKQAILTGVIAGVQFKIKPDVLHPWRIVDMKVMRDFETIWKNGERMPFVEAWGYDIQAAIYQEVEYQNSASSTLRAIPAVWPRFLIAWIKLSCSFRMRPVGVLTSMNAILLRPINSKSGVPGGNPDCIGLPSAVKNRPTLRRRTIP